MIEDMFVDTNGDRKKGNRSKDNNENRWKR